MSYKTSRVFILEDTNLDLSTAAEYGQTICLFTPPTRRASIWNPIFQSQILERLELEAYDCETDYFVVVGHMVSLTIVIALLCKKYHRTKFLLYSSTDRKYVPMEINV